MQPRLAQPLPPAADAGVEAEVPGPAARRLITWRRAAGATAAVFVLGGGGAGIWAATRPSGSSSASAISITTQNVTVSTGTMRQTVAASGTLEPAQESTLTFPVSGTVTAVDVVTGQKVVKGQTLATIDPAALADEAAAAQASLTAAQDRLSTDEAAAASTSTIESDQAQVASAQNQLTTAQTNLAGATLKATFDGTVAAVGLALGDTVSGGGSGGGANASGASSASSASSTGITVVTADSFTVSTSVDDTEIGQVKVGDQAVVTPSGSNTPVYGTVASVSLIASSSSSSSSSVAAFPVVIDVTGSPGGLFAGGPADVSIIVRQLANVLEVPTAALSYSNAQATVTRVVGGAKRTQAVTTGVSLNGYTQITSGLTAGDVVTERVVRFRVSGAGGGTLFGGGAGTFRTLRGGGGFGRGGGGGGAPAPVPGGG
jgi:macrolide-specific efflux system membrane fusion protein